MVDRYTVAIGQITNRYVVLDKKDGEPGVRICTTDGPADARALADRLNRLPIPTILDLVSLDETGCFVRVATRDDTREFIATNQEGAHVLAEILGQYLRSISQLHALGHPAWLSESPIAIEEPLSD